MTDYIAPIGSGIGDLLVSLPAVQALIDRSGEVVLVARSRAQEELAGRIEGLGRVIPETAFDPATRGAGDRWFNLRDHPLQRDWWWGSVEFEEQVGLAIDGIIERISRDLDIPPGKRRLTPLRHARNPELAGTILFVPGTDAAPKLWPSSSWDALGRALFMRGFPVSAVGPASSPEVRALEESGIARLATRSLGEVVDAVSSAAGVVAVDTGFFHLAVQQAVPAVGLFRRPSVFRRDLPHARSLRAPACAPACVAADCARAHHRKLERLPLEPPVWSCALVGPERCMARLGHEEALAALVELGVLER